MSTDSAVTWKHRPGDLYTVIKGEINGNATSGFRHDYYCDGDLFPSVAAARRRGFACYDHDDWNIGVVRGGALLAMTWMGEVVDDDPAVIAEIAEQVGFAGAQS